METCGAHHVGSNALLSILSPAARRARVTHVCTSSHPPKQATSTLAPPLAVRHSAQRVMRHGVDFRTAKQLRCAFIKLEDLLCAPSPCVVIAYLAISFRSWAQYIYSTQHRRWMITCAVSHHRSRHRRTALYVWCLRMWLDVHVVEMSEVTDRHPPVCQPLIDVQRHRAEGAMCS